MVQFRDAYQCLQSRPFGKISPGRAGPIPKKLVWRKTNPKLVNNTLNWLHNPPKFVKYRWKTLLQEKPVSSRFLHGVVKYLEDLKYMQVILYDSK